MNEWEKEQAEFLIKIGQTPATPVGVFNKLAASSIVYNVGDVSAPSVMSAATGDLLTCSLQVSVLTSWS